MTPTSSASFRDPENAAFRLDDAWFRIAGPQSADALEALRSSSLYTDLVAEGALLSFEAVEADRAGEVLAAFQATSGRALLDV